MGMSRSCRSPKLAREINVSAERSRVTMRRVPDRFVVAALLLLGGALRLGDLDAMVNVDMYFLWSSRTVRFMNALATGAFEQTYQSHHPGVTLMWLVGCVWRAFDVLSLPMALHPEKAKLAVWPIVVLGSLFPPAFYLVATKALGPNRRFPMGMAALLLATEPLLVAHSRNSHLDQLATTFAWLAVWFALAAKRVPSYRSAAFCGIGLGLALLSKISTAGFAVGVAALYFVDCFRYPRLAPQRLKQLTVIAVVAVATVFLLWPALWVAPVDTLLKLFSGLSREVDKSIPFMLFGHAGKMNVPAWVYGLFVVFLVTPEAWIPGVLGLLYLTKRELGVRRFLVDLGVICFPFVYLTLTSNAVGVRNIIPLVPLFSLLTALVVDSLARRFVILKRKKLVIGAAVLLSVAFGGRTLRVISLYPLPITYCSRWTGLECSKVFHLGWGEGMKEAAQFIGEYSRQHFPKEKNVSLFGSAYAGIIRVWTPVKIVATPEISHFIVDYSPDWQRRTDRAKAIAKYVQLNRLSPLHEVVLEGRPYVRIYAGPLTAVPSRDMSSKEDEPNDRDVEAEGAVSP